MIIAPGYVHIDEAANFLGAKFLASRDLTSVGKRGLEAARAYLMLVVDTQHDTNAPRLRFQSGQAYSDVYVNAHDVLELRKHFHALWVHADGARKKRGRPKGGGHADDELVKEGAKMVADHRANSIHDAARQLAGRARGNSYEAKVDRLRRKIKDELATK